jgi:mRNA interferase RelE/StbE
MYELFETDEFLKSISNLQKRDEKLIRNKLVNYVYPQIKKEPHFGINIKKLKKYEPETWRYRIGNFRVFYTIEDDGNLVLLLVVENRGKAYRKK